MGRKLEIAPWEKRYERGEWKSDLIFVGRKKNAPSEIVEYVVEHKMNGTDYEQLFNNCQRWVKILVNKIDPSFEKMLRENFVKLIWGVLSRVLFSVLSRSS